MSIITMEVSVWELNYKWFWIFIPQNISLEFLDGAVLGGKIFGRGLALAWRFPLNKYGAFTALEGGLGF